MELFAYINEMAVLGVSFLTIALGTIWYSMPLFQNAALQTSSTKPSLTPSLQKLARSFGLMFVAYSSIFCVLSYLSTIATVLSFSPFFFSYVVLVVGLALLLLVTVTEEKPVRYFVMHAGFLCILILSGSYIMLRWPW